MEKQVVETAKTNSKNFWNYVNSKRKTQSGVLELHETLDNETFIASGNQEKADALGNSFSSVFMTENDYIPNLGNIN